MSKPNVSQLVKSTRMALTKHSPEIFMGLGIAGMLATTVLAVRATPKAISLIEETKEELETDKLTPLETVKATWKCYIPAAVTATASTMFLINSCSVSMRRNSALLAAYKISDTALTEYREQVTESIGEKKEQHIREKVAQKQIEKLPVDDDDVYVTGKGNTLMLDPLSTRYFRSDVDIIRRAENSLNKQMIHDLYGTVSINDFYDEIGLPRIDIGDMMGWNTEHLINLHIVPGMTDKEEPCLVIDHYNVPRYMQ